MTAPDARELGREAVRKLVERFRRNLADYTAPSYNETSLRSDFLNPLFRALGWDVDNDADASQDLREVIQQATVEVEEGRPSKKPDYAFRLGHRIRFFVEAKKPSIHVGEDPAAAFQARRYGFSASHPISVLTNFDRTVIYRTVDPPSESDSPRANIVALLKFEDLFESFDALYDMLSRDSLRNGGFDAAFGAGGLETISRQFDSLFLRQIEKWRKLLAQDIAARNSGVDETELNWFVQRLLNRIIFLRICEDRDLERFEALKHLAERSGSYEDLKEMFSEAESRYNSGLFDLIDDPTLDIHVGSTALLEVLRDLYSPRSPYTFSVVETSVLGAIYEQFIARRLTLDSRRAVRLEDKPEIREAGGVFVTPRYIVDEIVRRTLMPLLDGKSPASVSRLRIADIACGSGTFLLSVFEFLQNWHADWYRVDGLAKHRAEVFEVEGGLLRLTLAEKRRILLNNLVGVDIDDQAVEITRFGLLLMLLQDENAISVTAYRDRTGNAALPRLDEQIRVGNSLVDPASFRRFMPKASADLLVKVSPFDTRSAFRLTTRGSGFDAIVGNPPYIRIQNLKKYAKEEVAFYQSAQSGYRCSQQDNFDKYQLFVERALYLLRGGGRLGYIIPNKFMVLKSGMRLRRILASSRFVRRIVDFGVEQVFPSSDTYTCLLYLEKAEAEVFETEHVDSLDAFIAGAASETVLHDSDEITEDPWVFVRPTWSEVFRRLQETSPETLEDAAEIFVGVQTSADKIFVIKPTKETARTVTFKDVSGVYRTIERALLRPCLYDVEIKSFIPPKANAYLLFPYNVDGKKATVVPRNVVRREFPKTLRYLLAYRRLLAKRNLQSGSAKEFYRYGRSQSLVSFDTAKIVLPILSLAARYSEDRSNVLVTGGGNGPYYLIRPRPTSPYALRFLLGVLSYPVLEGMVRARASMFRGGYYSHGKQFIKGLPLPPLDMEDRDDRERHDSIVGLVDQIVEAGVNFSEAKTPKKKEAFNRLKGSLIQELFGILDGLYGVPPGLRKEIEASFASDMEH